MLRIGPVLAWAGGIGLANSPIDTKFNQFQFNDLNLMKPAMTTTTRERCGGSPNGTRLLAGKTHVQETTTGKH